MKLDPSGKGYKKQMLMHLNYGPKGGSASFAIIGPDDAVIPELGYYYDTRKDGGKGFTVDGIAEPFPSWADLCQFWNAREGAQKE